MYELCVSDQRVHPVLLICRAPRIGSDGRHGTLFFRATKFAVDKCCAVILIPAVLAIAGLLLILNRNYNPGPLFYRQVRLGRNNTVFSVWKFRTMVPESLGRTRTADEGLETDRITRLGAFLRKYRVDELPNFFNVLKGDMSLIGPRPDAYEHALHYIDKIPHYSFRYTVKPGITGLAQVEMGYAEGVDATATKAHYDRFYIQRSCVALEIYIAVRTLYVVATGFGGK